MEMNTLECGARQIVLDPSDNYEIILLDDSGKAAISVYSELEGHVVAQITYPDGLRKVEQVSFSAFQQRN